MPILQKMELGPRTASSGDCAEARCARRHAGIERAPVVWRTPVGGCYNAAPPPEAGIVSARGAGLRRGGRRPGSTREYAPPAARHPAPLYSPAVTNTLPPAITA